MGFTPDDFQRVKSVGVSEEIAARRSATSTKLSLRSPDNIWPPESAGSGTIQAIKLENDMDMRALEKGAPPHFCCSICMHIMRDPVMLSTGQSYDKICIQRWLAEGGTNCPVTGLPLRPPVTLTPNWALSASIEEWCESNAPWLLGGDKRLKPVTAVEQAAKNAPSAVLTSPLPPMATSTSWQEIQPVHPRSASMDPDLTQAIRQQQAELERYGYATAPHLTQSNALADNAVRSRQGSRAFQNPYGSIEATETMRRPKGLRSFVVWELLCASAAYITLFLLSLANDGWRIVDLNQNPWVGASQSALVSTGAQSLALLKGYGQWWRLFTSPWLPAGLIQLLGALATMWSFAVHLDKALSKPWLTVPAIYFLGAVSGAAISANLTTEYVVCGASAGACSLMGGVWAEQLFNFKNNANQYISMFFLLLVTAVFVVTSFMPLVDIWYIGGALLAGFLVAVIIVLLPRVGRGRPRNKTWVSIQILCAILLVGGGTAAIVGLVLPTQLGDDISFFNEASCIDLKWWACAKDPRACQAEMNGNGTAVLQCANGMSYQVPAANLAAVGGGATSKWDLVPLCYEYCDVTPPSPASPLPATPPSNGANNDNASSPPGTEQDTALGTIGQTLKSLG